MPTTKTQSYSQPGIMPPTLPATQIRLQHFDEGRLAAEWRFARAFRIGRDAACDVCLDNPRVHTRHAEVYLDGAVWRARGLEKGLATLVNGAPLQDVNGVYHQDVRLGSLSTLQLGLYGPVLHLTLEPLDDSIADTPNSSSAPTKPPRSLPPPAAPRPVTLLSPAPVPRSTSPARYHGHGFTMPLPEHWHDQTLYTLAGPTADGIRHSVLIEVDRKPQAEELETYVDAHLALLQSDLDGFRLIRRDLMTMTGGQTALRLIICWRPHRHRVLFQEQLFVLHEGCGYTLTASFTNASRKQLGSRVEATMLGFTPTPR